MRAGFFLASARAGVCLLAGIARATSNPDTGSGCELGKLVWSDFKCQKGIASQVLMATTNGTFSS